VFQEIFLKKKKKTLIVVKDKIKLIDRKIDMKVMVVLDFRG
jgi:hypothetical protein